MATILLKKNEKLSVLTPTNPVMNLEEKTDFWFVKKSQAILELMEHRMESAVDTIAIRIAQITIVAMGGFVRSLVDAIRTLEFGDMFKPKMEALYPK